MWAIGSRIKVNLQSQEENHGFYPFMNLALIPGLYRAEGLDYDVPSLSPELSLPANQCFYKSELVYVSGAKEDPRSGSRNVHDPRTYWVVQPIDSPNEIKYAPGFPETFTLVPQAEIKKIIENRTYLKPQMIQLLKELLD
jgi:hypothetical protein